jgi:hypothetical protein
VGIATTVAQYASMIMIIVYMSHLRGVCRFEIKRTKIDVQQLRAIVRNGLPAGIQSTVFSISNVLIQSTVNSYGDVVVAGNAAAGNLEGFVWVAMNAMHQSTLTVIGQNMGAKKIERIKKAALISFVAALALPTVILNGSMWAQCDSIYGFFVVMCFYYILERKGGRAISMFALAFSFKLQAIFVLPAIIVSIFSGHLKPKKFVWLPIGFLATCLPALIFGRSFANTFMVYINQTQSYEHLDMNCPTVWRLVSNVSFDNFNAAGVMLGGLAAITIIYLGFIKR